MMGEAQAQYQPLLNSHGSDKPNCGDGPSEPRAQASGCGMGFDNGNNHAVDLLVNASAVVRVLADVSPGFHSESGDQFLSKDGAFGLYLVLTAVESTLQCVVNRL
jgi:hypothetical protein